MPKSKKRHKRRVELSLIHQKHGGVKIQKVYHHADPTQPDAKPTTTTRLAKYKTVCANGNVEYFRRHKEMKAWTRSTSEENFITYYFYNHEGLKEWRVTEAYSYLGIQEWRKGTEERAEKRLLVIQKAKIAAEKRRLEKQARIAEGIKNKERADRLAAEIADQKKRQSAAVKALVEQQKQSKLAKKAENVEVSENAENAVASTPATSATSPAAKAPTIAKKIVKKV